MTKKYSDLDNPTGISVKAGDDIIVLVGDTYGQNISMQCIWETGTEYKQTASSGDVYMLNPGVNKLTMKGEGQLFVMYNTELTSNTAKPIKIHIPLGSGTVNGFFDLKEHKTDEKYAELLKKSTNTSAYAVKRSCSISTATNYWNMYPTTSSQLSIYGITLSAGNKN